MATFTNAWDETIPEDDLLSGLSEAGKIDELIRQMKLDIRERVLKYIPVGFVVKWAGPVIPYGFKECKGDSLLRTLYPDLFSVIGTTYGTADATHFNLPDMRGRFARGWNHGKATGFFDPDSATRTKVGTAGATMVAGDHVGTEQGDENEAHTHGYYKVGGSLPSKEFDWPYLLTGSGDTESFGDENRPVNIYFKYIIRVDDEHSDGSYSYTREWDETIPVPSDYMGRMAMELRKLRVDIEELFNNFFSAGMIIYWPSATIPDGYVELNGQGLLSTNYPDLYDAIGDTYGAGDGVTTDFNVPDVRGLFIRAQDNGKGVDSLAASRTGGDNVGSTQGDGIKAHTHTYDKDYTLSFYPRNRIFQGVSGPPGVSYEAGATAESPGRAVDSHPMNRNLVAIMKAKGVV